MTFFRWLENLVTWILVTFIIGSFPMLYPWIHHADTIHRYNLLDLFSSGEGFSLCVGVLAGILLDEATPPKKRLFGIPIVIACVIGAAWAGYMYGEQLAMELSQPSGSSAWFTGLSEHMLLGCGTFAVITKISQNVRAYQPVRQQIPKWGARSE